MSGETCTRCGASVPPILSTPPGVREAWWRNRIRMDCRTYTMRFSMFRLRWMPPRADQRLRETYTTLTLCDDCARAVFAFAQTQPSSVRDGGEQR